MIQNVCPSVKAVKNIYVRSAKTSVKSVPKIIVRGVESPRINATFLDVMSVQNPDMGKPVLSVEAMYAASVLVIVRKDVVHFVNHVNIRAMDVKLFRGEKLCRYSIYKID